MRQTPLEVTSRYVHGIIWPATKETVLQAMQQNGAPDDVLQALRGIDHPRYVAPSDVHQLLWRYAATSPSPVNPYPHAKSTSR